MDSCLQADGGSGCNMGVSDNHIHIDIETYDEIVDNIELKNRVYMLAESGYVEPDEECLKNQMIPKYQKANNDVQDFLRLLKSETEIVTAKMRQMRDNYVNIDVTKSQEMVKCVAASSTTNSNSSASDKEKIYAEIQKRYGFTDEEMEYLKKYYSGLLSSLYGVSKYSTSDAEQIYREIRYKLDNRNATGNIDLVNEESRNNMPSDYQKYYDNNVALLESMENADVGKFEWDKNNVRKIYEENIDVYMSISEKTGVPPELICAIHYRESGGDFTTHLHNGQPLGIETTAVPQSVCFDDFEEAAVDALLGKMESTGITFDQNTDMATYLTFAETFNGTGYADNGYINPYLYSGTSVYTSGKYPRDHYYDPDAVDKQPGVYFIMNVLLDN